MSGEVIQDSNGIREVANELAGDKKEFDSLTEEFYEAIHKGITATDEGGSVWFGPSAAVFAERVDKKRSTFDDASGNMNDLIENLNAHADAWDQFESR